MTLGIYSITNLVNGKRNIGSSFDMEHRWRTHKSLLKNNKHFNKHLQASWNKYGERSFIFEAINICDKENLKEMEDHLIFSFDAMNPKRGYNFINASRTEMSEETRRKLRKANLGKRYSKEINLKKGRKNQIWSKESREKISESRKGIVFSKEHLNNLKTSHLGYVPTDEARNNMSDSAKTGWLKRKARARIVN